MIRPKSSTITDSFITGLLDARGNGTCCGKLEPERLLSEATLAVPLLFRYAFHLDDWNG